MTNNLDREIRHIKASKLTRLSTIIDKTKAWKQLLEVIPTNLSLEAIHLIEQQYHCGKSPTLALLNYWSITGRRRPTVRTLLQCLQSCNLKWAEEFVWREILGVYEPQQQQQQQYDEQEQANYNGDEESGKLNNNAGNEYILDEAFTFDNLDKVLAKLDENCPRFSFTDIYNTTNRFCHKPFQFNNDTKFGARVGDGRFSSVFLAKTNIEGSLNESKQTIAAKLLKSECNLEYLVNEINLALRIKHENILNLLGISIGRNQNEQPKYICLVYDYIQNGSLLECLANGLQCQCKRQLNCSERLDVATKVARGIAYLHSHPSGAIVHRDIKTANILIDFELNPKLGDFTLVRQLDSLRNNETQFSQNIIGTSVYMPPEAFRGDISTKFDIFSFGIVLLELLSGKKPFDNDVNEDLLTQILDDLSGLEDEDGNDLVGADKKNEYFDKLLDKRAGEWELNITRRAFELALRATEVRKRDRPEIGEILIALEALVSSA